MSGNISCGTERVKNERKFLTEFTKTLNLI